MRKHIIVFMCVVAGLTSQYNLFAQSVSIHRSAPHDPVKITVLPIKNLSENEKSGLIIADTLIGQLARSDLLEPVPLKLTVETLWEYYPSYFSVNPLEYPSNPQSVEFYGQLKPVQKIKIATFLKSQYIIDGTYIDEGGMRRIMLELYSTKKKQLEKSFELKLQTGQSLYDATSVLAKEIDRYFFHLHADNMTLILLQDKTAGIISYEQASDILQGWHNRYGENVFVYAGQMLIQEDEHDSASRIISAGKKWLRLRDRLPDRQIRFFKAYDANPYLIIGRAYMVIADYQSANKILKIGAKTFPFNTDALKRQMDLCERIRN